MPRLEEKRGDEAACMKSAACAASGGQIVIIDEGVFWQVLRIRS